jgi:hypothetical protein
MPLASGWTTITGMAQTSGRRRRAPSSADLRGRYGLLLGALMASFTLQGIAEPGPVVQVFVSALLGTTLTLALWAADVRPSVARPLVVLAGALVIVSFAESVSGNVDGVAVRLADLVLVFCAPPAIVLGVYRNLRARQGVTLEAVFGVLCLYILIGMLFAFAYGAVGRISGGFFAGGQAGSVPNCLYFSFITLTTVGYGDLVARSNLGHTMSMTEALVGQIYLVTVVSLIVSNLRPRSPRETRESPGSPS